MTLDDALQWADKFDQSLTPTTSTVTATTLAAEVRRLQAATCKDCSLGHMAERIAQLQSEVTGLRIYAPALRPQPTVKTAPIAPTDWPAWGMIDETDEAFSARAGRQVAEAAS